MNVYEIVRKEMLRQNAKYGTPQERDLPLAEYIMIIEGELQEAKDGLLSGRTDEHSALNELVQVAATALQAVQYHIDKLAGD